MNVTLTPEDFRFVEEQVKTGRFRSPEDVIGAALQQLRQDTIGDFAPGELAALVAEGEADIERGDVVDSDEVFRSIRQSMREYREQTRP